ncbi:MAG: SRPBCC family protein [Gammaproteobacteria bacterium]|nr:SRPBCC family protein [Gammaproteobacteria bacterium]
MPPHKPLLLALALSHAAIAAELDHVTVTKEGDRYVLEGEVQLEATSSAVYRVITDYDGLEKLDKGIAESRLIERVSDTVALVYTRMKGCVILFCRKVERIERVEEISATEIRAVVVPDSDTDVRYGHSHWELLPHESGTRVTYRTEVEPDFWIPAVIGPALIRSVLRRRVSRTLGNLEQAALNYQ